MSARFATDHFDLWLFDLDGTLVDTAPDLQGALEATLEKFGYAPSGDTDIRAWVGAGAAVTIERALAAQDVALDANAFAPLLAHFLDHYRAHIADRSIVYPGIAETLATLRERGIPMACVTNKYETLARRLLDAIGIGSYFPVVIGGDTLSVRKPDPEPLFEACRRSDRSPGRALMIGDSKTDVDAARNARIAVACVRYGYHQGVDLDGLGADVLVESVHTLL
ncbi:MAG TPA: phosphoglycolate phosphatase [Pseudomonadales bacterium]|nr:phosphoglycolate phosphatase [Pseudomonadales bacterium]